MYINKEEIITGEGSSFAEFHGFMSEVLWLLVHILSFGKFWGIGLKNSCVHISYLTDYLIKQTTEDASLGKLEDNLVMTKETHVDDVTSMGNLNNFWKAVTFLTLNFWVYYVAKLSTVDIYIPISQLSETVQLLLLTQKSSKWVLGW